MSINRRAKVMTKTVRIMTDPDPNYVSLVEHGANQTPWLVVKNHKIEFDTNKEESAMTTAKKTIKSVQKAMKAAGQNETHVVVKLSFAKASFADEASVTTWLNDGGYEDFAIHSTDLGFEVTSTKSDAAVETKAIESDEGVTFFIASRTDVEAATKTTDATDAKKEDEATASDAATADAPAAPAAASEVVDGAQAAVADEAATAPAEGAAETVSETEVKSAEEKEEAAKADYAKKVDFYATLFSDKTSISGVLKDAEDGIPMGAMELMTAFQTALINATKSNDEDAVKSTFKDFQKVYLGLWKVVDKITADIGQGEAAVKTAGQTTPSLTLGEVEGVVAKAMSDFEGKVSSMLASAVEKFTSKADEVSGVANAAKEVAEKANTTATQLEQTIQTRKGEDTHVAASTTTQVSKEDVAMSQRTLKATLGL